MTSITVLGGAATNVGGSGNNWSPAGNAIVAATDTSDGAEINAISNVTDAFLTVTDFDFSSIPDGSTINNITVSVTSLFNTGLGLPAGGGLCQLTLDGSTFTSSNQFPVQSTTNDTPVTGNATTIIGAAAGTWGLTLATTDIKASTFGFGLKISRFGSNTFVNGCSITIDYTSSASPTPTPTPTLTITPTITLSATPAVTVTTTITPTISLTPTITLSTTPTLTVTPTLTTTPSVTPTIGGGSSNIPMWFIEHFHKRTRHN